MRLFTRYLRPFRLRLAALGAVLLGASVTEGLGIGLFYPLIEYIQNRDAFLSRPSAKVLVSVFARLGLQPSVTLFIGLIFAVILLALLLKYAVARLSAAIYNPLMKDVRDDAFERVLSSHVFYFIHSSSAELGQILENDVEYLGQSVNFAVVIAASALSLLVYVGVIVAMSWRLTLLVAGIAALRYAVSGLLIRKMRALGAEHGALNKRLKATLTGLHQGIDVVKSFGAEAREIARFGALTAAIERNASALVRVQADNAFVEGLLGDGLLCVIVWLAVSRFDVSGALLLTFLFIVSRIVPKVTALNDARIRVAEYVSRMTHLPKILGEAGLPSLAWGGIEKASFDRAIEFERVALRYPGASLDAVHDVSLVLRRGESLALVGESGAGKSTLSRLLLRLFDPTSGRILVDGTPLPELTKDSWTKLVSVVSQDTFVFDDTLENNVKYGAPGCSDAAFREALRRARATEFVDALPLKEKTELGERGVRLSGGQRQRIAIARAFLRDSPILVLDEATSAMDSETERLIQEALDELAKDRTLLIIAHRLATVRKADRIVVLERGRLKESGTHAELVALGGLYRRFHELQAAP